MVSVVLIEKTLTEVEPQLVEHKKGVNVYNAWLEACMNARKDGLVFTTSKVPEEYLNACGLKRKKTVVTYLGEQQFGQTELEKEGIHFASCYDCASCEDGICMKYGDPVCMDNPGCIHGTDVFRVFALDGNGSFLFPILLSPALVQGMKENEDATEAMILQAIKEKGEQKFRDMILSYEGNDIELALEDTSHYSR